MEMFLPLLHLQIAITYHFEDHIFPLILNCLMEIVEVIGTFGLSVMWQALYKQKSDLHSKKWSNGRC